MSWRLFLDESGHDPRQTPYEVQGGVAIHARQLWPFVQNWQHLELSAFGTRLAQYRKELKGARLLDKDRFKWPEQDRPMRDEHEEEKGEHAVEATRKPPLGRISTNNYTRYRVSSQ